MEQICFKTDWNLKVLFIMNFDVGLMEIMIYTAYYKKYITNIVAIFMHLYCYPSLFHLVFQSWPPVIQIPLALFATLNSPNYWVSWLYFWAASGCWYSRFRLFCLIWLVTKMWCSSKILDNLSVNWLRFSCRKIDWWVKLFKNKSFRFRASCKIVKYSYI